MMACKLGGKLFPTMKSLGTDAAAKKAAKSETKAAETVAEPVEEVIDFSKVEIEPLFKDEVDFDTFSKSDFRAVKVKACVYPMSVEPCHGSQVICASVNAHGILSA